MTRDERLKGIIDNRSGEANQPPNSNIADRMNAVLARAHRGMIDGGGTGAIPEAAETISLSPVEILQEIQNSVGISDLGLDVLPTQLHKMQEVFESLSNFLVGEEHANLKKALAINAKQLSFIIPALDNEDLNHNKLPNYISQLTPINGIREYHQIYWLHEMADAETYSIEHRVSRLINWATTIGLSETQLEQLTLKMTTGQSVEQSPNATLLQKLVRVATLIGVATLAAGCLSPHSIESQQSQTTNIENQSETEQPTFAPYVVEGESGGFGSGDGWSNVLNHWGIAHDFRTNENGIKYANIYDSKHGSYPVTILSTDSTGRKILEKESTLNELVLNNYTLSSGQTIYLNHEGVPDYLTEREVQGQSATYAVKEGDNINSLLQRYLQENKLAESSLVRNIKIQIESQNPSVRTKFTVDELTSLSPDETNIWAGDTITFTSPYPVQE